MWKAYPRFTVEQQEKLALHAFVQALSLRWLQWHVRMVPPPFLDDGELNQHRVAIIVAHWDF